MGKRFDNVLKDLKRGLSELELKKENAKKHRDYQEIKRKIELQEIKIEFITKGYKFKEREMKPQKKISA